MGRTKNPHQAAIKSWQTRRKKAKERGGLASKGDYGPGVAGAGAMPRAATMSLAARVAVPSESVRDGTIVQSAAEELALQAEVAKVAVSGLALQDLPEAAVKGLSGIQILPERAFIDPALSLTAMRPWPADYKGSELMVRLNSADLTRKMNVFDMTFPNSKVIEGAAQRLKAKAVGKLLAHEIGHHAHLSRITDEAAKEWARLSINGENCKISQYGQQNPTEHFADAFAAYAQPDPMKGHGKFNRDRLKALSPEAHDFMERLWRTPSMWRPNGETAYDPNRGERNPFLAQEETLRKHKERRRESWT